MNVEIVDYSEKAIAVFGAISSVDAKALELKGLFNAGLHKNGVGKTAGYIFSKKHKDNAKAMADLTEGKVVDYSEKSVAVFPKTIDPITAKMVELKGMFNAQLHYGTERKAGWIFSKKQMSAEKILAELQTLGN